MKTGLIFYLRSIALLVLLQAFYLTGVAQELIGYNYSNYNGVNSIISNPASIVDSCYKVHFNLFTINAYGGNNGYEFNSNQVFKFQFSNWTEGNGYRKIIKNDLKNGWFNADILGPSLLLNLNKRTAVGFTTRLRMLANVYNVSNNILGLMGNSNTSLYGMDFNERNIKINAASFADIGITLAKVLKDQGKSLIKGGITLKYIQGISSVYVQADNININIKDINSIQKLNGSVSVVYPQSLDQVTGNGGNKLNNEINSSNRTIGMDLGLVYEVRSG